MKCWTKIFILAVITIFIMANFEIGYTQNAKQRPDTTRSTVKADSVIKTIDPESADDVIELLEINIEAVIEKPRVAILPKRVEPQLSEMEFIDRSFENELKKVPDKPMIIDSRLFAPKKIEDLKQKLLDKKKKLDKK